MKQLFTIITILAAVACTKSKDDQAFTPQQSGTYYFSRVLYYKAPGAGTDTIYTLPVTTSAMLDSCKKWNGRTISDNVVGTTIDKLWSK